MNWNRFAHPINYLVLFLMVTLGFTYSAPSIAEVGSAPSLEAASMAPSSSQEVLQQAIKTYAEPNTQLGMGLAIVAMILIFGGPLFIVTLLVTQHYRSQKRLAEFRRECIGKLINAGKDVPEALLFFDDLGADKNPEKDLRRGIKNIGLGLGIAVFLIAVNSVQAGTFGLILILLGCAQVLSWKLTVKVAV